MTFKEKYNEQNQSNIVEKQRIQQLTKRIQKPCNCKKHNNNGKEKSN